MPIVKVQRHLNMVNKIKAIIFDVDGTLADTEQYGHLPACNDAMKACGLDIEWTWSHFITLIKTIPGNANRLTHTLEQQGWTSAEIKPVIETFTQKKQEIYISKYLPKIKLREGVEKIIQESIDLGISLGIVSASHEAQIHALLDSQLSQYKNRFQSVLGKETGPKTDNNGFLYTKCVEELNKPADSVLVIEDSEQGLNAASHAGLATAIFYNDYTFGSAFRGARLVAPNLSPFSIKTLEDLCIN